jgi:hypothetical protein
MTNQKRLNEAWNRWMAMPAAERPDFIPILFGLLQFHSKSQSRAMTWIITEIESVLDKMEKSSPSQSNPSGSNDLKRHLFRRGAARFFVMESSGSSACGSKSAE